MKLSRIDLMNLARTKTLDQASRLPFSSPLHAHPPQTRSMGYPGPRFEALEAVPRTRRGHAGRIEIWRSDKLPTMLPLRIRCEPSTCPAYLIILLFPLPSHHTGYCVPYIGRCG
ncbi:hypothetical protein C8Q70DRAFT_268734 [Cubamyces menziesii]|nr:hypothetical protein C8Q70DRAFT_268734 [Cubamyces menziesii]